MGKNALETLVDELYRNGIAVEGFEITGHASGEPKKVLRTVFELDFSEHDKVFEDKIAKLEKKNKDLESCFTQREQDSTDMIMELKQRIADLESKETETCKKEPISNDCRPSMEWYENRHQSDCIEINRLNTTIDVLIHKVEYLRQFSGLE